jgi:hypothetical protein
MMGRTLAVFVVAAACVAASGMASAAPFCKTLKGESVSFGEPAARKDADVALDKEIRAWAEHYHVAAPAPKNRKMACKVYIEMLNEFACTAEASLCRDIAASAPKKR